MSYFAAAVVRAADEWSAAQVSLADAADVEDVADRLRDVPFVELKLDRSFVRDSGSDPRNAGICQTIINLAHNFGALAVAEGLENAADLQAVQRMGCDIGQGFFLARPMPKASFIALLEQRALRKQAS